MNPVVQELPTGRVVFGPGAIAQVPDEVGRLGGRAVLLIAGTAQKAAADPGGGRPGRAGRRASARWCNTSPRRWSRRRCGWPGRAVDGAGMGVHHKICHILGGNFGLPHAEVHAAVLPHAAAFNAEAAPAALARAARALGATDAPGGLWDLASHSIAFAAWTCASRTSRSPRSWS